MNLLLVTLSGIALFLGMQVINRLANLIQGQNKWVILLRRTLPLAELMVWLGFAFWAAGIVFTDYSLQRLVVGAMALVLIVAVGWYVLRDLINGILLKSENALSMGQTIKSEFASGKITGIGYRTLQLETDKGDKLRVPYSQLHDAIISQPPPIGQSHTHLLRFNLNECQQPHVVARSAYRELVNMPWVISESEPGVSLISPDSDSVILEVKFTVLNEEHAILVGQKIEAFLADPKN